MIDPNRSESPTLGVAEGGANHSIPTICKGMQPGRVNWPVTGGQKTACYAGKLLQPIGIDSFESVDNDGGYFIQFLSTRFL